MDERRREAWDEAFAKLAKGVKVWEMPEHEHYELLRVGIFEGLDRAEVQEEARLVVRYWLHGFDLEPIKPRGSAYADNWFAMKATWGTERQAEMLVNLRDASNSDIDCWDALSKIAVRYLGGYEDGRLPGDLANWLIELLKGERIKPQGHRGDRGRPRYANDVRNSCFAEVFGLLGYLGLESKMDRYDAIAKVYDVTPRTVTDGINKAKAFDGKFPKPWEPWPIKP